jgi:hypothetical protein
MQRLSFLLWLVQIGCVVFAALILLPAKDDSKQQEEEGLAARHWRAIGGTEWVRPKSRNGTFDPADDPADFPRICPRDTICSEGAFEIVLITGARLTAYFMYPILGAVFLTKCHAINTALANTVLHIFISLSDLHNLHTLRTVQP